MWDSGASGDSILHAHAKRLYELFLESPAWRTVFSVVLPILAGVFSGTLVAEITVPPNGISWVLLHKAKSSYVLVGLSLILYWYNRATYKHDRHVRSFLDTDYCRAYMRSKCLPEAAERYRALIRDGQIGEFEKAMREVNRILK